MSAVVTTLSVAAWVALLAVGYWAVSTARIRSRAMQSAGRAWTRRLGVIALVVGALATGAFSLHPPLGVYLLAVTGVLAYVAGVLAAAGAAGVAFAATGSDASVGRRVRAFWYAAGVHFRGTRLWFGTALVAFVLTALVAALSVNPLVSATGAVALGGVLACVVCLPAAGVFVPAARNRSVAEAVEEALGGTRS